MKKSLRRKLNRKVAVGIKIRRNMAKPSELDTLLGEVIVLQTEFNGLKESRKERTVIEAPVRRTDLPISYNKEKQMLFNTGSSKY